MARKLNIRGGFNAFSYSRRFDKDGITYNGDLNLRSGSVLLDWFPFGGGFHLSPGALVYNGIGAKANALVPAGQTFTLGGTTYQSDTTNPITGKGNLDFTKAAPCSSLAGGISFRVTNTSFSNLKLEWFSKAQRARSWRWLVRRASSEGVLA